MTDASQPRSARGKMLPAGILATALIALLAFAPLASATPDPVGGGTTTVNLSNKLTKYLKTFGIKVQKQGSAKVKGNKATFKNVEGSMDPTNGIGTVKLGGGLSFNAKMGKKTKKGVVTAMVLNTNKKEIQAKVGGKKMKFATIAGWNYSRDGFGVKVTIKSLKITGNAARQLNKKTGYPKGTPKPFIGGFVIGKGNSEVEPSTVAVIATGNSTLTLSAAALQKLSTVGPDIGGGTYPFAVKLGLVDPAKVTAAGPPPTVAFPITGGTMSPNADAGVLQHSGGLTLTQDLEAIGPTEGGTTTLTMGNIWVDLGTKQASVEVTVTNTSTNEAFKGLNLGNLGRASIADISLTGATVNIDPAPRTVSSQNAAATLQAVTAETLNQVFISPVEAITKAGPYPKFAAGDALGTFSTVAQTQ